MNTTNVHLTAQSAVVAKAEAKLQVFGYTLTELAVLIVLFGTALGCYYAIYEIMQSVFN